MSNVTETLRQKLGQAVQRQTYNWEVIVGIVIVGVLLCLALAQTFARARGPSAPPPALKAAYQAPVEDTEISRLAGEGVALRPQQVSEITAAIQRHETQIRANPYGDDVPGHYMALGNIHRLKLKNYEPAIEYYQFVISAYSDDRRVPRAYLALAQCYEQMGNQAMADSVYMEMVTNLDPDSEYAKFASSKLQFRQGF